MNLILDRRYVGSEYTVGKLLVNGSYFSDTLERKVRDLNKNGKFDNGEKKVWGDTAIPYGIYKIKMSYSTKFKRIMPYLLNVPEFTGVMIHPGNWVNKRTFIKEILINKDKQKLMLNDNVRVV